MFGKKCLASGAPDLHSSGFLLLKWSVSGWRKKPNVNINDDTEGSLSNFSTVPCLSKATWLRPFLFLVARVASV